MDLLTFIFVAAVAVVSDGFTVRGLSGPLVIPLGSSVVLPCYVDELLPMKDLEVEWRRTDSEILVHLYQDGESRPEVQQQDYHDRAHFFTDQIQHGNFSLRLDNLRAQDYGQYACKVYSQQDSGETVVTLKSAERLLVSGSSLSISASVGEDVTLNCSVDSHITPKDVEVSWKKTDEDEYIPVLLYQDHEVLPEAAHEQYRDRAEFFTDEIPKGNFSLRLKSVRTEDKGVYMCQVFAGRLSANTTVVLERLGFSVSHIMVLILCVSASGSALLFCCLIYCRSPYKDSFLRFHLSLVVCPNMIMFFAFVLWGVSEGSVNETVCCCALYFLRPLLILWAAPYINDFRDKIKTLILEYSYVAEYVVFTVVAYSALFTTAWQKLLNFAVFDRVVIIVLFSIVFLSCLCKIIYLLVTVIVEETGRIIEIFDIVAEMIFDILPTLQFILLFYTFASSGSGFIIIIILPVFLMMTNEAWFIRCEVRLDCSESVMRTVMIIFTLVMNAVMIALYIMTLEKTTDPIGWACVLVFLQILWTVMKFTEGYYFSFDKGFHRFVPVYLFGSVGFILLSSAALITELILKTVNGDRTVEDLRFIIFPVECFFAVSVLISGLFDSKITECLQSCQEALRSRRDKRSQRKQNTAETHKMKHLKTEDPEETQSDSVMSQT